MTPDDLAQPREVVMMFGLTVDDVRHAIAVHDAYHPHLRLDTGTDEANRKAILSAERARIRAAVEGLPERFVEHPEYRDELVDRAAVLAAIDGERREPLGGIEQFQDEDR